MLFERKRFFQLLRRPNFFLHPLKQTFVAQVTRNNSWFKFFHSNYLENSDFAKTLARKGSGNDTQLIHIIWPRSYPRLRELNLLDF